jgi:hypothetical protein
MELPERRPPNVEGSGARTRHTHTEEKREMDLMQSAVILGFICEEAKRYICPSQHHKHHYRTEGV